jgi:signal transduction histidine kinase/ActR/RegA family two-component response regulator
MTQTTMHAAEQVRVEQIRSIYRNTAPGNVTTLVTVFVLTGGLVYIDGATPLAASVFLSIMFVQTALRLLLIRAYSRGAHEHRNWRPWAHWFTVGAFVGGLTIGTGSIWMVATLETELQLIALLLIFAVTSGAVGAFAAYPPSFFAFFFAIAVTPTVWLFTRGDPLHVTIGGLFVLWFLAVSEQARRAGRQFAESIRLRLENLDLVEDLRREKALAEEANVAKSRFLASASHDLRQPVHALSVFVGALRAHEMDAPARGLVDHIDNSVRALSGLFEGLLDISRLDAGVVEVHRAPFALQPLIERVCRDYDAAAQTKGIALRVRPTRAVVHSDPMLCERILRNIVANAVMYTDRGTVLVGCRPGPQLRVQVWDTGAGIVASERERVFQEFYQIGNSERDRTRGVGLGLAIVKRLTTLLDHRLQLHSWPGRGTCFTFAIPYASTQAQADLGTSHTSATPIARGSGLILVVDDEGAIQIAMQSLLQSWGYSVIVAGSYAQILERVGTCPDVPRLIICDYRLRDNEIGSTVIERLRNEYNDDIPGILITGDTAPDRIREAQASGYLLLHKPVPNDKLRTAIASTMAAQRRSQSRTSA